MVYAWQLHQLGIRKVWKDYATEGEGAKVAILDSGVSAVRELEHVQRLTPTGEPFEGANHDTSPQAHGTQTASLLAARGGQLDGVARGCTCLAYGVGNSQGQPLWALVARALEAAVAAEVDLICCPFTFPSPPGLDREEQALRAGLEAARAAEIPIIVSAGNSPYREPVFPVQSDPVVAVGVSDRNDRICSLFRWKEWMSVSAPGTQVVTLNGRGRISMTFSGTSASAPLVAGVAALGVARARAHSEQAVLELRRRLDELLRSTARSQQWSRRVCPKQFLVAVDELLA